MFRSSRSLSDETRDELVRLGTAHITFQIEDGWFVVGPTGLFVVSAADGELRSEAQRVSERAQELRASLAQELSFVPFVDAVLISDEQPTPTSLPCITLGADRLRATIAEGPRTVDDATLGRLGLLALQRLA